MQDRKGCSFWQIYFINSIDKFSKTKIQIKGNQRQSAFGNSEKFSKKKSLQKLSVFFVPFVGSFYCPVYL